MLGARLRQARQSRRLSLKDVASRAQISVATLSRIERDKQGLDLGMFFTLSKILKTTPQDLMGSDQEDGRVDPLASQIARMDPTERTRLWKDLSAGVRSSKQGRARLHNLSYEVEELLAQIDFLRDEIRSVQKRLRR